MKTRKISVIDWDSIKLPIPTEMRSNGRPVYLAHLSIIHVSKEPCARFMLGFSIEKEADIHEFTTLMLSRGDPFTEALVKKLEAIQISSEEIPGAGSQTMLEARFGIARESFSERAARLLLLLVPALGIDESFLRRLAIRQATDVEENPDQWTSYLQHLFKQPRIRKGLA